MIPLYKLFMVSARMFAKPVVNLIKRRHKATKDLHPGFIERFFILLGNREYRIDLWMNKRLSYKEGEERVPVKSLNNDVALERGIEFFYEILVYALILSITVMELRKASLQSKVEKEKKQAEIDLLRSHVDKLEKTIGDQVSSLVRLQTNIDTMNSLLAQIKINDIPESSK